MVRARPRLPGGRAACGAARPGATPPGARGGKGKVDERTRERATEQGLAAIDGAAKKVEEEFDRAIQGFGGKLKQFVEDSGDRLYRQVSEALDRVVVERARHSHDHGQFAAELSAVRTQVATVRTSLAALKAEVAP